MRRYLVWDCDAVEDDDAETDGERIESLCDPDDVALEFAEDDTDGQNDGVTSWTIAVVDVDTHERWTFKIDAEYEARFYVRSEVKS